MSNSNVNIEELKPWQQKLNSIIFGSESKAGKWFDIILLIVILLSIVGVMLESVPSINLEFGIELAIFEWIVTVLFTLEYLARLLCLKRPINTSWNAGEAAFTSLN